MIKVNFDLNDSKEQVVEVNHFPDCTQRLKLDVPIEAYYCEITWKYACDEELVTLMFLVGHIREKNPGIRIALVMGYIPNARMDRTKNDDEVFTLKYFCGIVNGLGFDRVYVVDPHSNVSTALIDRMREKDYRVDVRCLYDALKADEKTDLLFFFPDAGAMGRYGDIPKTCGSDVLYGEKERDWNTGKITGLTIRDSSGSVVSEDLSGKPVIIVDDIVSYGGTMRKSVDALKKIGAGKVYIYCSHLENSVLDCEKSTLLEYLDNGTVERLYSQDTLFTGEHERIELIS